MIEKGKEGAVVRVRRAIEAPASAVFEAWLDPEAIGKWMFGPGLRDEEVLRITLDRRVGGAFSFVVRRVMVRDETSESVEIDHLGEYLEIVPPAGEEPGRLSFTWTTRDSLPDVSRVEVEIAPRLLSGSAPSPGPGTRVEVAHHLNPKWLDYAERTEIAWEKMTEALAVLLEPARPQAPPPERSAKVVPIRKG